MSWITRLVWPGDRSDPWSDPWSDTEDLFQSVPVRFDPDQAETQLGDDVTHQVVRFLVGDLDEHQRTVSPHSRTCPAERRAQPVAAAQVPHLHGQYAGFARQRGLRLRAQQATTVQYGD